MKTLIFSDTHLTHKFEPRKYLFLKGIIEEADRVVINGDFWDFYQTTFDRFVNSEWQKIFPLLLEKQCVYIYGNHDFKKFSDERVNLFSVAQSESISLKFHEKELIVTHGDFSQHKGEDFRFLRRLFGTFKFFGRFYEIFESIYVQYLQRVVNRKFREKIRERENAWLRAEAQKLGPNKILIAAHSHLPELALDMNFINSGYIRFGIASYILLDESGLQLVETSY